MPMHTTLFMAQSANGFIARKNGEEDFLSDAHWEDVTYLVKTYGNLIIGRGTYEAVKSWGEAMNFDDFTNEIKIVLTNDTNFSVDAGYLIEVSPQNALKRLEANGHKQALIIGPRIATSFLQAGLLNELIVNIEPILVGEGKNLFAPAEFTERLTFVSLEKKSNGILQLRYHLKE